MSKQNMKINKTPTSEQQASESEREGKWEENSFLLSYWKYISHFDLWLNCVDITKTYEKEIATTICAYV